MCFLFLFCRIRDPVSVLTSRGVRQFWLIDLCFFPILITCLYGYSVWLNLLLDVSERVFSLVKVNYYYYCNSRTCIFMTAISEKAAK